MVKIIDNPDVELDKVKIKKFFIDRASRANELHELAPVIYQDNDFSLAKKRDMYEKEMLVPEVVSRSYERVIDLGCGIGRWAECLRDKADYYYGTDLTCEFIEIAQRRFAEFDNVFFENIDALGSVKIIEKGFFSSAIISGLLIYLNDAEVFELIDMLAAKLALTSTIVIREPLCVSGDLVLDDIWSDDLNSQYSAKYRNYNSFSKSLGELLDKHGFSLKINKELYPDELNNRKETKQFYFVYKRGMI